VAETPSPDTIDTTNARPLARAVCGVFGHRWELVDDTELRKAIIVVPPGSDEQVWFVHDLTCTRCGAEAWAEAPDESGQ
jgi:hypothetical protein